MPTTFYNWSFIDIHNYFSQLRNAMADPATLIAAEQVVSTTVEAGAVAAYGTQPSLQIANLLLTQNQALHRRPNLSPQPSHPYPPPPSFHAHITPSPLSMAKVTSGGVMSLEEVWRVLICTSYNCLWRARRKESVKVLRNTRLFLPLAVVS